MTKPKLVTLPTHALADIPNVLRCIATEIEAGKYGEVTMAQILIENSEGDIENFGAGKTDFYRGVTLLNKGLKAMLE